ncbi:MAG: Spy/CpxP family protein refolding chaperone [Nitrospirales bacterium]
MTLKQLFQFPKNLILATSVCALTFGFPLIGFSMGYGQSDVHHGNPHASPHGFPHHASGTFGHGTMPHGASMPSGHGMSSGHMGSGHGHHQSASAFIDHILKFKEGMAITDDQVAKLQSIKTDFEKTKIKMKADMQLTSLDLHELLRDDKGELGAVEDKLKSLYALRASMYLASVKAGRDAKSVLTDEQRARMKTVHDRINAYKEGGLGKGHPGGYSHHGKEKKDS